jgi:hypothetical protein
MPAVFDLTGDYAIQQGADYALALNLTTSTSAPLNLTGYNFQSQIRANPGSTLLASFTISTTGATGTVVMSLPNTVTSALAPTSTTVYYGYDVLMTSNTGVKTRILEGAVELDAAITR